MNYNNESDDKNYDLFKKEQLKIQAILKDRPELRKIEGIKSSVFGDLIMKSNDASHKKLFFKAIKNETITAIDSIIYR